MNQTPSLSERVKRRLTALNLRMARASKLAGLGPTYVTDLVHGKVQNPRLEHLGRLANVLETTIEWLTAGKGEETPSREQIEFERVQALLRRVDPADLPQAERALRGFVRDDAGRGFEAEPPPAKKKG